MVTDEILKDLNLPLKDYYICYFDILGYRAFIENNPEGHKKFLCEILLAIGDIESEIRRKESKVKINIKTYSDNFLLFFEKVNFSEYYALKIFSQLMQKVQVKLLMNFKILLRGGITKGEFFVDNQIVFGEGLIKAVTLEEKVAKFPRVVIGECKLSNEDYKKICNFIIQYYDLLMKYWNKEIDIEDLTEHFKERNNKNGNKNNK